MQSSATQTAFDLFHPVVALVWFAGLLVLGMVALQPVYLVITFVAAVMLSFLLRGARATLRTLAWQIALIALVALGNALLSSTGSTELFRMGYRAVYLESLVYGCGMGLMLAGVILTFFNAAQVFSSDKVMALFGGVAPTVGLMVSMVARLLPVFVRRGRVVSDTQRACTAAQPARNEVRFNMRLTSVLMGWGMEDALETADAMKARGWGSSPTRSTYRRFQFRQFDVVAVVVVGVLLLLAALTAWVACTSFRFYPEVAGFAPWWNYVPYVLFAALPLVFEIGERVRWR